METGILIREFRRGDEAAFRRLNEEWISRYFVIEPKDEMSFSDPQGTIVDKGGRIFLALLDETAVGCCALVAMTPGVFEVSKMAVTESAQGKGIGRSLLVAVVNEARLSGANRLYIETNHVLTPAIRLYESLGFRHIPRDQVQPSPYARSDVAMELFL